MFDFDTLESYARNGVDPVPCGRPRVVRRASSLQGYYGGLGALPPAPSKPAGWPTYRAAVEALSVQTLTRDLPMLQNALAQAQSAFAQLQDVAMRGQELAAQSTAPQTIGIVDRLSTIVQQAEQTYNAAERRAEQVSAAIPRTSYKSGGGVTGGSTGDMAFETAWIQADGLVEPAIGDVKAAVSQITRALPQAQALITQLQTAAQKEQQLRAEQDRAAAAVQARVDQQAQLEQQRQQAIWDAEQRKLDMETRRQEQQRAAEEQRYQMEEARANAKLQMEQQRLAREMAMEQQRLQQQMALEQQQQQMLMQASQPVQQPTFLDPYAQAQYQQQYGYPQQPMQQQQPYALPYGQPAYGYGYQQQQMPMMPQQMPESYGGDEWGGGSLIEDQNVLLDYVDVGVVDMDDLSDLLNGQGRRRRPRSSSGRARAGGPATPTNARESSVPATIVTTTTVSPSEEVSSYQDMLGGSFSRRVKRQAKRTGGQIKAEAARAKRRHEESRAAEEEAERQEQEPIEVEAIVIDGESDYLAGATARVINAGAPPGSLIEPGYKLVGPGPDGRFKLQRPNGSSWTIVSPRSTQIDPGPGPKAGQVVYQPGGGSSVSVSRAGGSSSGTSGPGVLESVASFFRDLVGAATPVAADVIQTRYGSGAASRNVVEVPPRSSGGSNAGWWLAGLGLVGVGAGAAYFSRRAASPRRRRPTKQRRR